MNCKEKGKRGQLPNTPQPPAQRVHPSPTSHRPLPGTATAPQGAAPTKCCSQGTRQGGGCPPAQTQAAHSSPSSRTPCPPQNTIPPHPRSGAARRQSEQLPSSPGWVLPSTTSCCLHTQHPPAFPGINSPPKPSACPGPSVVHAGGSSTAPCSRGPGRCREGAGAGSGWGKAGAGSPFSGSSAAAQLHNAGARGLVWATRISWPMQARAVAEPAAGQRHEEPHQEQVSPAPPNHQETHEGVSSTATKNSPKPSCLHQPCPQPALLTVGNKRATASNRGLPAHPASQQIPDRAPPALIPPILPGTRRPEQPGAVHVTADKEYPFVSAA